MNLKKIMSGDDIANKAREYVNQISYKFGGDSPSKGFDCSGLVKYVYKEVTGQNLPHSTGSLINLGKQVSKDNLQPGDLVFPSSGHVDIYSGNNNFIHAPCDGQTVKEANIYAFHTVRRLI